MNLKQSLLLAALLLAASAFAAQPSRTVAGASTGGNSPYATDAYPGFEGLDDIPRPERREKAWFSWWLGVSRTNSVEQYAYAKELEAKGEFRAAAKACDALVREWPASLEAPQAQLRFAKILATELEDYEEAFEQVEYLLDFYSRECPYLETVEFAYRLVNTMVAKRKTFLGLSFLSSRQVRQRYESVVRHAPGAKYVPEVMLKIAAIREDDLQYDEAAKVFATLQSMFPHSPEARIAAYREARARMWLCRRLAYNVPRCRDTLGYLKLTIARNPDLPQVEELRQWQQEVEDHLANAAYKAAKFYDCKQRTRHAAIASWQNYLAQYPRSPHAEEVRARIAELTAQNTPTPKSDSDNQEKKQ